ncbi:Ornithine cyclodeaminase [Streptomyces murinus]
MLTRLTVPSLPFSLVRPPTTRTLPGVSPAMQCAAVTTLVADTRVPPQNWLPDASVICMTNGYAVVVVVVPPTMGWGAALAVGEASSAVVAAAAVATRIAAVRLARVGPNMSLLSGVAPVGGSHG